MDTIADLRGGGNSAIPVDVLSTPHHNPKTSDGEMGRHTTHAHEKGAACETMEAPTKQFPIHPHYLPKDLEPLGWIAGKWSVHEPGRVIYPTIKDFTYAERIEFDFSGQKMLDYKAESWNPAVGSTALLHREVGFLRIKPGTNQVALVIAHNFGVSEVLEGTNQPNRLVLETTGISRMAFAAETRVVKNRRVFTFDPTTEELEHVMEMETEKTPMTEHLRIRYKRDTHAVPDGH